MSRGAEASLREFVDLIKFATFACKLLNINTAVKVLMRQLYGASWTAYTHWEARKCKLRPKFWLTKWLPFPCHLSYRPAKPGNLTADHHYFSSSLSPADRRGSEQFDGQLTTGASSQGTSWPGSRVTQSRLTRLTWTWRSPLTEILSNPASVPVLIMTLTLVSQPFSA